MADGAVHTNRGAKTSVTVLSSLISTCSDGPAVSLNGSPTVSPTTAALWVGEPLPPYSPVSMNFLALSHAPPPLFSIVASRMPPIVPTMRNAATARERRAQRRHFIEIRGEQQERGQRRGADGVALGQRFGGVADGVEPVGAAADLFRLVRHLDHAAGVVGDRAEGVHRQDVGRR